MGAPGWGLCFSSSTPSSIQTLPCLGQAQPGWGQLSLRTPWRPLPTDHTAVFPEASLGCGFGDMEAGKESCFSPQPFDSGGGIWDPRSIPRSFG